MRKTSPCPTTAFFLLVSLSAVFAFAGTAADNAPVAADPARKVVAYYFHGKVRCSTCVKIEMYTDQTLKAAFPGELASGLLEWKPVNVNTQGNEHYTTDYQLYTKSVVLSELVDGKERRWKNLEKVWELVGEKEEFRKYVEAETRAFLQGKPGP